MRVGLLVDSACDLPYSFIKENGIFILPLTVRIDGETVVDDHDPVKTRAFYDSGLLAKGHSAETEAFTAEQIHQLLLDEVVTQYDFAFLETIAASRSQIFANAWEAMQRTMVDYRPRRKAAGRPGSFSMRVVDSGTFFGGQGILAAHTIHLIKQGIPKQELRTRVSDFTRYIYGALVPRDLYYIRQRGRARGDNSVSGAAAFLSKAFKISPLVWGQGSEGEAVAKARSFEAAAEKMFQYGAARVRKGLLSPYVVVSADPTMIEGGELDKLPGFQDMRSACHDTGVELLVTPAGISSSLYVGPGSVGLALAAEPHIFATEY